MVKKHQQIKVIKVPLRRLPIDRPQVFPRMPRLYLELIENKAKIKQDLINKEYIAPVLEEDLSPRLKYTPPKKYAKNESELSYQASDTDESGGSNSESEDEKSKDKDKRKQKNKEFNKKTNLLLNDDSEDDIKKDNQKDSGSSSDSDNSVSDKEKDNEKYKKKEKYKDNSSSDDSEDLSVRLKELLNADSASEVSFDKSSDRSYKQNKDKYSRHRDSKGHSISYKQVNSSSAPTLSELEKQGGYIPKKEFRDINQTTMNEQMEEDSKRELLFKFDLLKKSYPSSIIPEYTIHTDIRTMQKSYGDTVRRLSLDSSVDNYKTYIVYGFMGCEFIFGNFLGFDMQGFTQQQILSMNSYEKLLIELGEKSYVPSGSKWPVELRLLFMIIMNAAFFVISKMIMKKTGANILGMVNSMNASPVQSSNPVQRKRKMKGPNIDLNIPDLESTE
jgi:hypothetical protein